MWELLYTICQPAVYEFIDQNPVLDRPLAQLPEIINRYFDYPQLELAVHTDPEYHTSLLFLSVKSSYSIAEAYARMGKVFADKEFDAFFENAAIEAKLNVAIG